MLNASRIFPVVRPRAPSFADGIVDARRCHRGREVAVRQGTELGLLRDVVTVGVAPHARGGAIEVQRVVLVREDNR